MRNTLITIGGTIAVPSLLHGLVPYLILRQSCETLPDGFGSLEVGAILLAMIGLGMVVWVAAVFVARGRGTAVPLLPPEAFVAEGLFKFVRNPMYVGLALVIVAEAIFFRSWWLLIYAFAIWSVMNSYVVYVEEPRLARRFGEPYLRYVQGTPRWIPRWPRRQGD